MWFDVETRPAAPTFQGYQAWLDLTTAMWQIALPRHHRPSEQGPFILSPVCHLQSPLPASGLDPHSEGQERKKKTFSSTVGEVKPGQRLIWNYRARERFPGESVHNTVLQVVESRLSTTNCAWWGTRGWEQFFSPLSVWYCRTGLLFFPSILKLHSRVHSFAGRLTGGCICSSCLLQRDYVISCFQLKWLATVPSFCDHPSAAAPENLVWEEAKRMNLAEKSWVFERYLRFHISFCITFGMSHVDNGVI